MPRNSSPKPTFLRCQTPYTDTPMENVFEAQAQEFEKAAAELELAVAHLRHVASHFRNREVPRAAAHATATRGHMLNAGRILDDYAVLQASKSSV